MGNKRPQAFTQEVCSGLRVRLARYKFLLHDYQTPLFHNQLLDAIRLHEETVQAPTPTPAEHERVLDQIVVLDNMHDRLNKHWDELHKSMDFRTTLLANISLYQSRLGAWLMLDYTGKCSKNCTWASSTLGYINNVGSGGVGNIHNDYRLYQQTFVRPLKEMMLNQDHVKKRLRIAATGSTRPAGMIYHLIDRCDWGALAYAVINDRELAVTLFGAKQLNPGFWNPQSGTWTVQKIDDIRDKYFDELSTPEKYTISKRARKLSAKKAASAAHPSSPPPPLSPASSPLAEEASALVAAKSIYNKVVSGLAFEGAGLTLRSIVRRNTQTTSPWAGSDSTTQLIDPSEKEKG